MRGSGQARRSAPDFASAFALRAKARSRAARRSLDAERAKCESGVYFGFFSDGSAIGTKRVSLCVVVVLLGALRSSASNRIMKISASMLVILNARVGPFIARLRRRRM